jgi:sulfide:quinone oxidoreductase
MRLVVIGGSFGGLTVAHEVKRRLPRRECDITVIAKERRFVFIPALPWVASGTKTLEQISFDLEKPLASKGVHFVEAIVRRIDPQAQKVHTDTAAYDYDYLVIATGHRSANEAVPGLGPFAGPGHSLMSPPEAEEARDAWAKFLQQPGPVVVGCAPGASCIGPAYEFAFEIDHVLKRRHMRHRVPITFVTPEPFLGHFGIGGVGILFLGFAVMLAAPLTPYVTVGGFTGIDMLVGALATLLVLPALIVLLQRVLLTKEG